MYYTDNNDTLYLTLTYFTCNVPQDTMQHPSRANFRTDAHAWSLGSCRPRGPAVHQQIMSPWPTYSERGTILSQRPVLQIQFTLNMFELSGLPNPKQTRSR